jgi:hypothetical protein
MFDDFDVVHHVDNDKASARRNAGVLAGWTGCVSLPTRQTLNIC